MFVGQVHVNSAVVDQTPPAGVMRKSGPPPVVKFLLFDRGPWQKSPRAASKRKVIVSKLNLISLVSIRRNFVLREGCQRV
ncbi:hypothetical protein AVEN_58136-1 [Araneus ventricosus]|uniref:Uncharacterized protein n=1 Tax=Araneus ventricosus TaxID=182803 RepID=A0A4Y2JZT0_ARAVE|nr:hypothetical protein AVEN_58136-1 [Araneus ventricosus]